MEDSGPSILSESGPSNAGERRDPSNDNVAITSKQPRKKKKRPRVKSRQSTISSLEGLEDDVIEAEPSVSIDGGVTHSSVVEHSTERLFVQNKKGFEPATRDKVFRETTLSSTVTSEEENKNKSETLQELSIFLQGRTRLLFSFCHGILGGFGVCHISLILSIADHPEAVQKFAEGYPEFARAVQILYYVLSAICFVSVLDRCDFAAINLVHCGDLLRYRIADIFTVIFYFSLLVATIVCTRWDDRFALSLYDEDLWKDQKEGYSEFVQWRIFSLLRGTFAVAGYITMFFGPDDDLFYVHLCNLVKNAKEEHELKDIRY